MSWHYSQALEEAYSEANSVDGEPSVLSKSMNTPGACLWPDKMTDASNHSQSGTTCEPSTASRGMEWWTSSLAASRAKTSAPQTPKPKAYTASEAASGVKWLESSVRFDRPTSSWKTHRCLWEEDLDWSSVTWPQWGMMLAGVLWERGTLALPTSATESGYWPTPNCSNDRSPCLHDAKLAWKGLPRANGDKVQARLQDAAAYWPTPRASDGERGGRGDLIQAIRGNPNKHFKMPMWPTPRNRDWKDTGTVPPSRMEDPGKDTLGQRMARTEPGGKLNPEWVEWLMGWPISWTACEPLATDKWRLWCRSFGLYSHPKTKRVMKGANS